MTTTETPCDWTILEDRTVAEAIDRAARVSHRSFEHLTTVDDLKQDAYLYCAEHAEELRELIARSKGGLVYLRVYSRLIDKYKTQAKHSANTIDYVRLRENDL